MLKNKLYYTVVKNEKDCVIPLHVTPFPENPSLHVQLNPPCVFKHVTPGVARLQLCSEAFLHSFMSEDEGNRRNKSNLYDFSRFVIIIIIIIIMFFF